MGWKIEVRAWNIKFECWYHIDDTDIIGILTDPDFIIEQFTGVKTKDGKKIYVGDILRGRGRKWGGTRCGRQYKTVAWIPPHGCRPGAFNIGEDRKMGWEIIGNIHQNPELLGGPNAKA